MASNAKPDPLVHEIVKLGLEDSPYLIPGEQVQSSLGVDSSGQSRIVIYVKDIEVQEVDSVGQQVRYKVVGLRQLTQPWDLGGSYLDPRHIDPSDLVISNE
jgi:hypothetical protein